jgi:hypothetical protein
MDRGRQTIIIVGGGGGGVGVERLSDFSGLGKEDYYYYTQRISHKVVFAKCVTHSFMSFESFREKMDSSSSAILLLYAPQRL